MALLEQAELARPDLGGGAPRATRALTRRIGALRGTGILFWISATWIVLVIGLALLAPVLPLDPNGLNDSPFLGPSFHHLLGTDDLGRDLFARLVYGARISLAVGFGSVGVGLVVGGTLGLLAGFFEGVFDLVMNGLVANVALAFPPLIFLLAAVTFLGSHLVVIIVAIGVLGSFHTFRVVRGATVAVVHRPYVEAARVVGATRTRMILREVLPGVVPPLLAVLLVGIATAIMAEAGLAFLGLSVAPPTATWGAIVAEGQNFLARDALICLWPALTLCLTVLALNFVADSVRSRSAQRASAL